mgnify:CR=1 FL=1
MATSIVFSSFLKIIFLDKLHILQKKNIWGKGGECAHIDGLMQDFTLKQVKELNMMFIKKIVYNYAFFATATDENLNFGIVGQETL